MGEQNTALDVDTLIENIRREVIARAPEGTEKSAFQPVNLSSSTGLPTPQKSVVSEFKMKSSYNLDEFLLYNDREFVTNAYRGILHREPDSVGLDNYSNFLRQGIIKPVILAYLMKSREGQQKGVVVSGMRKFLVSHKLLRYAGPVARWLNRRTDSSTSKLNASLRGIELTQFGNLQKLTKAVDIQLKQVIDKTAELTALMADRNQQTDENFSRLTEQITNLLEEQQKQIDTLASPSSELPRFAREINAIKQQLIDDQRSREKLLADLLQSLHGNTVENANSSPLIAEHREDRIAAFYRAFEDECRGTLEQIRKNLSVYIPEIQIAVKKTKPTKNEIAVLDVGCGRGEWLGLLEDNEIKVRGIDLNPVMVAHCRDAGLDVIQTDAVDYLKKLPDATLSVVTGFHIVEHLDFDTLFALFDQTQRVLRPGGMILFETPNPENVLVGSHTFYHDPTHKNPITPTFIQFLARYFGLTDIVLKRLHPYPESAKVPGSDPLTERVNGHLCGPQDFSILAYKP
ncbi:MAG: methyltransferase domain-containing protein [Methylococcales bacterium]